MMYTCQMSVHMLKDRNQTNEKSFEEKYSAYLIKKLPNAITLTNRNEEFTVSIALSISIAKHIRMSIFPVQKPSAP